MESRPVNISSPVNLSNRLNSEADKQRSELIKMIQTQLRELDSIDLLKKETLTDAISKGMEKLRSEFEKFFSNANFRNANKFEYHFMTRMILFYTLKFTYALHSTHQAPIKREGSNVIYDTAKSGHSEAKLLIEKTIPGVTITSDHFNQYIQLHAEFSKQVNAFNEKLKRAGADFNKTNKDFCAHFQHLKTSTDEMNASLINLNSKKLPDHLLKKVLDNLALMKKNLESANLMFVNNNYLEAKSLMEKNFENSDFNYLDNQTAYFCASRYVQCLEEIKEKYIDERFEKAIDIMLKSFIGKEENDLKARMFDYYYDAILYILDMQKNVAKLDIVDSKYLKTQRPLQEKITKLQDCHELITKLKKLQIPYKAINAKKNKLTNLDNTINSKVTKLRNQNKSNSTKKTNEPLVKKDDAGVICFTEDEHCTHVADHIMRPFIRFTEDEHCTHVAEHIKAEEEVQKKANEVAKQEAIKAERKAAQEGKKAKKAADKAARKAEREAAKVERDAANEVAKAEREKATKRAQEIRKNKAQVATEAATRKAEEAAKKKAAKKKAAATKKAEEAAKAEQEMLAQIEIASEAHKQDIIRFTEEEHCLKEEKETFSRKVEIESLKEEKETFSRKVEIVKLFNNSPITLIDMEEVYGLYLSLIEKFNEEQIDFKIKGSIACKAAFAALNLDPTYGEQLKVEDMDITVKIKSLTNFNDSKELQVKIRSILGSLKFNMNAINSRNNRLNNANTLPFLNYKKFDDKGKTKIDLTILTANTPDESSPGMPFANAYLSFNDKNNTQVNTIDFEVNDKKISLNIHINEETQKACRDLYFKRSIIKEKKFLFRLHKYYNKLNKVKSIIIDKNAMLDPKNEKIQFNDIYIFLKEAFIIELHKEKLANYQKQRELQPYNFLYEQIFIFIEENLSYNEQELSLFIEPQELSLFIEPFVYALLKVEHNKDDDYCKKNVEDITGEIINHLLEINAVALCKQEGPNDIPKFKRIFNSALEQKITTGKIFAPNVMYTKRGPNVYANPSQIGGRDNTVRGGSSSHYASSGRGGPSFQYASKSTRGLPPGRGRGNYRNAKRGFKKRGLSQDD